MKWNRKEWEKIGVMAAMTALLVGAGFLGQELRSRSESQITAADYVKYEKDKLEETIDEHNGEVLVDSLELTPASGPAPEDSGSEDQKPKEEISLVTSDEISQASGALGDGYFAEQKATLSMDRQKIISLLDSVMASAKSEGEKTSAAQQKLKLIDYMEQERTMESLIGSKGYANVMVVMTDSSVTVTVGKQTLQQSDVAKIMDIVLRETGRSASQVVIQSKN